MFVVSDTSKLYCAATVYKNASSLQIITTIPKTKKSDCWCPGRPLILGIHSPEKRKKDRELKTEECESKRSISKRSISS